MNLKPETSEALDKWIGQDTWYKGNAPDMKRFYRFVDQFRREHGHIPDEMQLREEIANRAGVPHGPADEHDLRETIKERVELAQNILEFLDATDR